MLLLSPVHQGRGDVLFSDDFSEPDGTPLAGKSPDIGTAWSQTSGPAMSVVNSGIDTTGAARIAFAGLASTFDGSERLLKMTVDFTRLNHGNGYGGISLFLGTQELLFFGDTSGEGASIGIEGAPQRARATAQPDTPLGIVTLTYDFQTGRTNLYAGEDIYGLRLATIAYEANMTFDQIRIANGNGGDIGVGSILIETLPVGPPSVDVFEVNEQITLQGHNPILRWETSFADQIAVSAVPGATNVSGSVDVELAPGDQRLEITATDSVTGLTATASTIARSVIGGALNYRYLRFNTVKTRDPAASYVQLSEIEFYDPSGKVLPVGVTNPGGVNPVPEEGPASLIDNNPATKWVDDEKAPLVFDFGPSVPSITEYSFATAANLPGWDPVMWTIEGSNDGLSWTLVENVTAFDFNQPLQRQTYAPIIPFPGPSLIPLSFRILSSNIDHQAGEVTLTWESTLGASYRITASDDLADWSTFLRSGIAGAAGSTTAAASFPSAPRRFFRVELE